MSQEKQIEEMARTLCGEKEHTCNECDSDEKCEFWIESSILFNAGYRKQSETLNEVEKILHENRVAIDGFVFYHAIPVNIQLKALKRKMEESS